MSVTRTGVPKRLLKTPNHGKNGDYIWDKVNNVENKKKDEERKEKERKGVGRDDRQPKMPAL